MDIEESDGEIFDVPASTTRIGPVIYPDPITGPADVSAATFLYFDEPVNAPQPAWISTEEAFELYEVITQRDPAWAPHFMRLENLWDLQIRSYTAMRDRMRPLAGINAIQYVQYVYDADDLALDRGAKWLTEHERDPTDVLRRVNVTAAAGEVLRHILLEAYLAFDRDLDRLLTTQGVSSRRTFRAPWPIATCLA